MPYNFDEIVVRKSTDSYKYDYAKKMGKPEAAIPLWVADMDFRIPPEAKEALLKSVDHSIFGYTITLEDYDKIVQNWFSRYFNYETKASWIVKTPGVVFALAHMIRAFTKEGDAVLIQKPVYQPFENLIKYNKRKLVVNSLVNKDNYYCIDFDDFERKIFEENVKLFILCSPHNPVARVWTRDELYNMGKICQKYGCLVVSDEIHCDITYEGHNHSVFSTIDDSFAQNAVICTAPSKTFNLAGLQNSNIFIANKELRLKLTQEISKSGYQQLNTMGVAAAKAVYQYGHDWLAELKQYLKGNLEFMRAHIKEKIPQIKIIEPEGSYLVWLDFRAFGLSHEAIDDILLNKAGVWLSSGTVFGDEGEGFQRINIACPRATLESALGRMEKVNQILRPEAKGQKLP